MSVMWSSAGFTYYLMGFYVKYIPGDLYLNATLAAFADCFACLFAGLVARKTGSKNAFTFCFINAIVMGVILSLIPED